MGQGWGAFNRAVSQVGEGECSQARWAAVAAVNLSGLEGPGECIQLVDGHPNRTGQESPPPRRGRVSHHGRTGSSRNTVGCAGAGEALIHVELHAGGPVPWVNVLHASSVWTCTR